MKNSTLVLLVKDRRILLGMKKRGFGKGRWNGFGGAVKYKEEIHEAAHRELFEESCMTAKNLQSVGELTSLFPLKPEWNQVVHVFLSKDFSGQPAETDEMKPKWFDYSEIPYSEMWADDRHWLPKVLSGKNVRGKFIFGADNARIETFELKEM